MSLSEYIQQHKELVKYNTSKNNKNLSNTQWRYSQVFISNISMVYVILKKRVRTITAHSLYLFYE